jgi:hypothetical protein
MNKGLATQQLKSRLKNDQNNHLSIQLEQFIKIEPQVINQRDSSVKVPYESQFSDTVTFAYVRGYN